MARACNALFALVVGCSAVHGLAAATQSCSSPGDHCHGKTRSLLQTTKREGSKSELELLDTEGGLKVLDMIHDFEERALNRARSGGKPTATEQTGLQWAYDLIENTTIPNLRKGSKDVQVDIDEAIEMVAYCNAQAKSSLAETKIQKDTQEQAKLTSDECGDAKTVLEQKNQTAFNDLEAYVSGLSSNPPGCALPSASSEDTFFKATLEWFERENRSFWAHKSTYVTAKADLTQKLADCQSAQAAYEESYCLWHQAESSAVSNYESCYANHSEAFKSMRSAVMDDVDTMKKEFVAAKRVQCYISVLLVETDQKAKALFEKCQHEDYDTSEFNVTGLDSLPDKIDTSEHEANLATKTGLPPPFCTLVTSSSTNTTTSNECEYEKFDGTCVNLCGEEMWRQGGMWFPHEHGGERSTDKSVFEEKCCNDPDCVAFGEHYEFDRLYLKSSNSLQCSKGYGVSGGSSGPTEWCYKKKVV
eukprot:TRINITY_DN91290_c0_g1_i1.p1 TRINITY_DN91290_c0_g1~~TRINITY_DN91290_c0_g1_i1.p1  ORF type:complete len:474 (+),score=90.00 TRINITY_DN91290_c0_g1_i1:101-1522(+)